MSPEVEDRPKFGFARLTLRQMAVQHCGGIATEHNENCPECVLNRRCRALVASYEAKVDDLRRETLRSEELALERDELRVLLREAQAAIEAFALLNPESGP